MRYSRTPQTPAAGVEAATSSQVQPDLAAPGLPLPRRVSTEEFVASLERDEVEGRREELASRVLLSGEEFRTRLRLSPKALCRAVKDQRIYSLCGPSNEAVYPAFFTERSPGRAVLERVCKALGDLPGVSKHFFLTSTRFSLGNITPLQALARGKEAQVLALAEAFKEE